MQLDSVGGEGTPKHQYPPDHFYHQICSSRPSTQSDSFIQFQLQRPNYGKVVLTFNQYGIPKIRRTLKSKKLALDLLLKLLFLLVLSQSLLTATARKYVHSGACSKSRAVLNAPWGVIQDGPAQYNYTKNTHCEWLVNGTSSNFISLKFHAMSTECSYDYVFVHDGQTFNSPLLGSFSGKTLPQSVVASSGYLLVILYSDTNYVLEGFRAEYSLTECPHNCTDKGECVKGICHCNEKYAGDDCSLALCPDECGKSASRGKCVNMNGLYKCQCNAGFVGDDCSLDVQNYVGNTWSSVSRQGPGRLSPRTSHSSAYDAAHDRLYVYGGYDLNTVTDQFMAYNFQDNTWTLLSPGQDYDSQRWSLDKENNMNPYPDRQPVFQTTSSGVDNNSVDFKSSKERQVKFAKTKNSTVAVKFLPPVPRRGDTVLETSDIADSEDYETTDYNTLLRHRRTPMMQEKLRLPELIELDRSSLLESARPPALRGHKMIKIGGGILLYGGKLADGTVTNSLWLYNISSGVWSLQAGDSSVRPTPVWQHTLNLAGDHVYVFGGSTVSGRFVSDMFRISVDGLREWEVVEVRGGKALDIRVTGHTCIYHQKSHSLFVYGGILTDVARFSKLSDRLFNFNLDSQTWTEVFYPKTSQRPGSSVPREMAFHTASVVGNYMVIFGGYSHRHNQDEVCYSSSLYLYHLDCQIWVHHEAMEHTPPGTQYPKTQGVFGHSTEVRNGSELILIGGYHGTVTGDVLGYKLPSTIASEVTPCELYGSYTSCTANPKCGWCGSSGKCHQSTETYKCHVSNLQMSSCPAICPALATCYSCTTHGRNGCEWCVHTGKCHDKGNIYGCPKEAYGKPRPWWGDPVKITSADACRNHDFRPGLTLTKYR